MGHDTAFGQISVRFGQGRLVLRGERLVIHRGIAQEPGGGRVLKMLQELVDQKKFRIICATHSPILIDAPETYVINLDRHINRNVLPDDQGVEGASTIQ